MALIHCPECQKEVSSVALACPQCAFPYPGRKESGNGHYEKSLRTCPDCNRVISRQVHMCPHCGAPTPETGESSESLEGEMGGETVMCPHCGVPFIHPQKAKKPVETFDPILSGGGKGSPAASQGGIGLDEAGTEEGLTGAPSFPMGRRRKALWDERIENYRESPRHSRPKKPWKLFLFGMMVMLLLLAGWVLWEFRDMSGLEALVYWNR